MANEKISDLPPWASPALAALFPVVHDPAGTPETQAGTILKIYELIIALTSYSGGSGGATQFPAYIASAGPRRLSRDAMMLELASATSLTTVTTSDVLLGVFNGDGGNMTLPTMLKVVAALTALTAIALDDKLLVTDTSASNAAKAVTVEDLFDAVPLFTQFTDTIDGANDKFAYWDHSASAIRYITPTKLFGGLHTIFLPAGAFKAQLTNGAASYSAETSSNDRMLDGWAFDTTTKEYIQARVWMPKSWNLADIVVRHLAMTAANTGGVVFATAMAAIGDDDSLDAAWGSETDQAMTLGTVGDSFLSAATSAVDIAGSPATGDELFIRIGRQVSSGSDTKAGDAIHRGLHLFYETAARDDT